VSPTDLSIITGANKTLVLDTPVWDNLSLETRVLSLAGIADPLLANYQPTGSGIVTKLYEFEKDDIAYFMIKIPHEYKIGTNIYAHLHWTPSSQGVTESGHTVGWKIGYSWSNVDDTFPAMSVVDLSDSTDGTNGIHQRTSDILISGTDKEIDSIIIGYIIRTDTGTDDTWDSSTTGSLPLLLSVDFRYQKDTLGSREIDTK